MLGPRLSGGVVVVPRSPGAAARRVTLMRADHPVPGQASAGTVLVACGGECTVSLGPDANRLFGRGGPGQEAAIGAAPALDGVHGVAAMFADTDGSDGGTPMAGGLVQFTGRPASGPGSVG
jgi:glycerate-2-kinase